jgi:hypothetical protein
MNSRLTLLALVAVLLAAFAVPALAAPNEATPSVQSISTRALAKARLALLTARSAKSQSRTAVRTANAAVNTANEAKGTATATQAALESVKVQSAFAAGSVITESETPEALPGGPSLSLTVPASGLIEVWAQARVGDGGGVTLYEDGQQMAGQDETGFCSPKPGVASLFAGVPFGPPEPILVSTPSASGTCGSVGPPGAVMFQTTPGRHTFELRYQLGCGCEPEASFSQRLLRVAPRL